MGDDNALLIAIFVVMLIAVLLHWINMLGEQYAQASPLIRISDKKRTASKQKRSSGATRDIPDLADYGESHEIYGSKTAIQLRRRTTTTSQRPVIHVNPQFNVTLGQQHGNIANPERGSKDTIPHSVPQGQALKFQEEAHQMPTTHTQDSMVEILGYVSTIFNADNRFPVQVRLAAINFILQNADNNEKEKIANFIKQKGLVKAPSKKDTNLEDETPDDTLQSLQRSVEQQDDTPDDSLRSLQDSVEQQTSLTEEKQVTAEVDSTEKTKYKTECAFEPIVFHVNESGTDVDAPYAEVHFPRGAVKNSTKIEMSADYSVYNKVDDHSDSYPVSPKLVFKSDQPMQFDKDVHISLDVNYRAMNPDRPIDLKIERTSKGHTEVVQNIKHGVESRVSFHVRKFCVMGATGSKEQKPVTARVMCSAIAQSCSEDEFPEYYSFRWHIFDHRRDFLQYFRDDCKENFKVVLPSEDFDVDSTTEKICLRMHHQKLQIVPPSYKSECLVIAGMGKPRFRRNYGFIAQQRKPEKETEVFRIECFIDCGTQANEHLLESKFDLEWKTSKARIFATQYVRDDHGGLFESRPSSGYPELVVSRASLLEMSTQTSRRIRRQDKRSRTSRSLSSSRSTRCMLKYSSQDDSDSYFEGNSPPIHDNRPERANRYRKLFPRRSVGNMMLERRETDEFSSQDDSAQYHEYDKVTGVPIDSTSDDNETQDTSSEDNSQPPNRVHPLQHQHRGTPQPILPSLVPPIPFVKRSRSDHSDRYSVGLDRMPTLTPLPKHASFPVYRDEPSGKPKPAVMAMRFPNPEVVERGRATEEMRSQQAQSSGAVGQPQNNQRLYISRERNERAESHAERHNNQENRESGTSFTSSNSSLSGNGFYTWLSSSSHTMTQQYDLKSYLRAVAEREKERLKQEAKKRSQDAKNS